MINNYDNFLFENKRENKIKNLKNKIFKFFKNEKIIDYIIHIVTNDKSTKGLQYVIWFCNVIKNELIQNFEPKKNKYLELQNIKEIFINYLTNNEINVKNQNGIIKEFENYINKYFKNNLNKIISISDWLKSPLRTENINLKSYDFEKAYQTSDKWHKELKATGIIENETGKILLSFPDGYYWIDLETNTCETEAEAMGHCGLTTYGDTLYSLRHNKSPHITVALSKNNGIIYQMKGKENTKPIEKYYPYIVELLAYPNCSKDVKIINSFNPITDFDTSEYEPEDDFHITDLNFNKIKYLYKKNKTLIENNSSIKLNYKLYNEGLINGENFTKKYKDLEFIDNKIHFIFEDWSVFDESIFTNNNGKQILKILSGDMPELYDTFEYNYSDYYIPNKNVAHEIIKYCEKNELKLKYTLNNIKSEINLDSKTMKFVKNDISINISKYEEYIYLEDLLKEKFLYEINNLVIDTSELDNLRDIFSHAYTTAQEYADYDAAFNSIVDTILDKIGNLIQKDKGYWDDGIHVELNFDYIIEIEDNLDLDDLYIREDYIIDIINSVYNSENEDLLIDVSEPYYGWQGTIKDDDFFEILIDNLNY